MNLAMLAAAKFWILDPLYSALGWVLTALYAVIPSYGIAIILLTVFVSILRMPLVAKQVKSQQQMQRIQPELKRLQTKYKADAQKRNEELMKLYKEHDVNPFAGCLPLALQMPLFIVLYRLILRLTDHPPQHISKHAQLYSDLVKSGGKMQDFGLDLARKASSVHGFGQLFPYAILIALVVGTGLFQQRQMTARMPKDGMNNQLAVMGKVIPVFFGFISFNIPAGVVLYFIVSNSWQIGQQAFLFRHQPAAPPPLVRKSEGDDEEEDGDGGRAKGTDAEKPKPKPSRPAKQGFFARMSEAASAAQAEKTKAAGKDGKAASSGDAQRGNGGRTTNRRAPAARPGKPAAPEGRRAGRFGRGKAEAPPAKPARSTGNGRAGKPGAGGGTAKGTGSRPSSNGRSSSPNGGRPQPGKGRTGPTPPKPRNQRRGK